MTLSSAQPADAHEEYLKPLLERVRGFECKDEAYGDDDSLPASPKTVAETIRFIRQIPREILRLGAALGADGSIALVW